MMNRASKMAIGRFLLFIQAAIVAVIAAVFLGGLGGCASLDNAGVASYSVEPIIAKDGAVHCCRVEVRNGKEIASVDAHIERRGDDLVVDLKERGVVAFRGQEIAAEAAATGGAVAKTAALAAGGAMAAPALIPIAGAAMVSGTLPAAAVGAVGGAVVGAKVAGE